MLPGTYDFGEYIVGDTVSQRTLTITRTPEGGSPSPENLTGATVIWTFYDHAGVQRLQMTEGSGLSHTGVGGVVTLDQFVVPDQHGVYSHHLEIDYPDGRERTYISGALVAKVP